MDSFTSPLKHSLVQRLAARSLVMLSLLVLTVSTLPPVSPSQPSAGAYASLFKTQEVLMTDEERPPNLLRQLENSQDPWQYLSVLRQVELPLRAQYLQPWMDLVAKRPPLERDALIEAGKEIWRYRAATVREHLDQSERQSGVPTVIAPTVVLDDKLAEMVYRPGSYPEICYLVHDFARPDDPPVLAQTLEAGGKIHRPPTTELIHKKVVLLPSAVEEYVTDLDLFLDIKELAQ